MRQGYFRKADYGLEELLSILNRGFKAEVQYEVHPRARNSDGDRDCFGEGGAFHILDSDTNASHRNFDSRERSVDLIMLCR